MIILDTTIWIALLKKEDSCHELARKIIKDIHYEELSIFDHVYYEAMTVLRNKTSELVCWDFRKFFENFKIKILNTDQDVFSLANGYFFIYKKLSFVDALILASAKLSNFQLITFDKELQKAWTKIA